MASHQLENPWNLITNVKPTQAVCTNHQNVDAGQSISSPCPLETQKCDRNN